MTDKPSHENDDMTHDHDPSPIEGENVLTELDNFSEINDSDFEDDLMFENDDFNTDTDSFDDDDHDTHFDDFGSESSSPSKAGINWFNIGVIGAVIIAIGAISYNFLPDIFGSSKPAQQSAPTAMSTQDNQKLLQQAVSEKQDTEKPIESFFDNPDQLADENDLTNLQNNNSTANDETNDLFNIIDESPQMTDQEMDDLFASIPMPADNNIPTPPQTDDSPAQVNSPSDNTMIADTLPRPADDVVNDNTPNIIAEAPIASMQDNRPSVDIEGIKNDMATLNGRVDDLGASMNTFMSKLDEKFNTMMQATEAVTTAQPVAPIANDTSDRMVEIQNTLTAIEKRITTLENSKSKAVEKTSAPAPPVKTKQAKAKTTKTSPKKRKASPAKKAYTPPKTVWELKGASPGKAFLSEKGTQNLKTVMIGESVKGLGQIQSIQIENGQWIVRGTRGVVRQ